MIQCFIHLFTQHTTSHMYKIDLTGGPGGDRRREASGQQLQVTNNKDEEGSKRKNNDPPLWLAKASNLGVE